MIHCQRGPVFPYSLVIDSTKNIHAAGSYSSHLRVALVVGAEGGVRPSIALCLDEDKKDRTHDWLALASKNILAVTLMELVKVLQLRRLEWKVVCGKRNASTHNNQFCFKVIHHETEEVISTFVEVFVR